MEFLMELGLLGTIFRYLKIMGIMTITREKRIATTKNSPINP
jgi:hypothetical protein